MKLVLNDDEINMINNAFDSIYFYNYHKVYSKLFFKFNVTYINKILELEKKIMERDENEEKKALFIIPIGTTDVIGYNLKFLFKPKKNKLKNYFILIGSKNNLDFIHELHVNIKHPFREIVLPMNLQIIEYNIHYNALELAKKG